MFKTLYSRIAAILLGLFLFIGLLYILLTLVTTRLYIQEADQRLHHDLARYLVTENFFIQDGKVNQQALKESFEKLMHVNPNIELYVVDMQGNVLAYSAPPGKIRRKQISLEPLKHFLNKSEAFPILGDDPRDYQGRKVFSAAPIPLKGQTEGYLYIILGSEEYDSVAHMLQTSYILRLSIWVAVAGLVFVFFTGLFLFNFLTRRLRRLAGAMETFKQSGFYRSSEIVNHVGSPRDEIDHLGTIFTQMSDRMIGQMNKIRKDDSMRRELVSSVSHDLRTPLATLQGYLETLLLKGKDITPQEQKTYLTTALKHSERLGRMVSELFELAKLDSSETRISAEPFHLGELVHDIFQKFQLVAEKKKVHLRTKFPEDLPFVFADIGLIEQAMQNLIENALRFTREDGIIMITLIPEKSSIVVQVSDDGQGISKEHIPYIFNRFYRIKDFERDDTGSAGLGLAITKRILELHGSSIEVASELRVGTTFTFHLPVYRTDS